MRKKEREEESRRKKEKGEKKRRRERKKERKKEGERKSWKGRMKITFVIIKYDFRSMGFWYFGNLQKLDD